MWGEIQHSWLLLFGFIIRSLIAWAFAFFASSDRSRHVLAHSNEAIVDGKASFGFRGVV